ncbi:MAG: hypothetical protein P4L71_13735 [Acetobacteraceae bacterium]|nr:hypothetical protein [Acetobacteraceae bacterium]
MIAGAVVVGDLLRPDGSGRPGGTDRPTLWLWNAIKRQVHRACALPVEILTTTGSVGAWIESLRAPDDADTYWASVHAAMPPSEALDRLVIARLRGRFCIGYELPPWLVRLLDAHAVPHVDLRLHPIRFMDDLMFAVRASRIDTQAALLGMAVQETEVLATAGLREAMCRFISEAAVPDDTLMVIGQRRFDSTQIVDGGFFDAAARAAEIHALCVHHAAVVLKPHPLDRHHSLLEVAAASPGRVVGVIDDNVYRLMALPQIGSVLTVNSGVAYEAPYFGKRVHTLAPLTVRLGWQGDAVDRRVHAALDDVVLTPDFWRMVLAPHAAVSAADGMRLRPKPNRLRIALDSFWNFQEIDTDRIPRAGGS